MPLSYLLTYNLGFAFVEMRSEAEDEGAGNWCSLLCYLILGLEHGQDSCLDHSWAPGFE